MPSHVRAAELICERCVSTNEVPQLPTSTRVHGVATAPDGAAAEGGAGQAGALTSEDAVVDGHVVRHLRGRTVAPHAASPLAVGAGAALEPGRVCVCRGSGTGICFAQPFQCPSSSQVEQVQYYMAE